MSRMTKVPTTKAFLGHNTKSKLDSLPHLIDLYDESVCECAEENLLHLKELKSIQLFVGATTNLFELPKPTKTSTSNQPWEGFCLRTNQTNIEDPKKVKVVNPKPHSTSCNPEPKSSFFWIHLILNPNHFILLTFVVHLRNHLKMWMNLISVTQPAPLPI